MAVHKVLISFFVVLILNFFQKLIEDVVGIAVGDDDAVSKAEQISYAAFIDWTFCLALLFQEEMKVDCWLHDASNRKVVSKLHSQVQHRTVTILDGLSVLKTLHFAIFCHLYIAHHHSPSWNREVLKNHSSIVDPLET